MGWKLSILALLFAIWALLIGALVIGIPILLYLFFRVWSNRSKGKAGGTGRSHWMTYLGVFLLFLSVVAVAEQGTYSPVVFAVSGLTLLTLGLFPGLVNGLVERVEGLAEQLRLASGKEGEKAAFPCVELTQIPLDYLEARKDDPKERLLRFQRLAQTLAELGGGVELRLEFAKGSGRIMFVAVGREASRRLQGLLQVVRSQLPEFGAEPGECPVVDEAYTVPIGGVPEQSIDPLGPLARYFVENHLAGGYGVTMSPAWVNPVSRWLAGRRQRKLAEGSGFQQVDDDRTTTVVDHPKQVELEESVKGLERLLARRPVRVSVQVSAQDGSVAVQAANVLAGTISSHRIIDGLRLGKPHLGRGGRRSTLMLPSEAAPYFWLPQVPFGLKVCPSAEFQLPPMTEGEIVLGEAVGLSGKSGHEVRIPLDQLARHVFLAGATGSGKTTDCFSILLQLYSNGIPFLVVEPVKSEYRSLLAAIPDLQVFTVGDEDAAPLRLNIFEPPPGVKVRAHVENLVSLWNGSFVSYAPVPYVVERIFVEVYKACGWSLADDTRGRPITFDDLEAQIKKVVRSFGYEPRVTMDVEASIGVRLGSLKLGGKEKLFGSPSSTPLEAILERPTVVELRDVTRDDEKAFISALLLMNMAGYAQARGPSRKLRHFTLIEEAHRILPRVSAEKGNPESADPRRVMVEQFGNMLAELRAYGEGLAVVEQIPTKILPDAIKNTATKVVHRVPASDDREAMAGAMNATDEQAGVFTALRPGEAVVSVEGHPVPVRVEVDDVVGRLAIPVGEVSDRDVKRRMGEFYERYPLPEYWPKPLEVRMREAVDTEEFRDAFLRVYRAWVRGGQVRPLLDFAHQAARGLAPEDVVEAAVKILSLAAAFYLPFNAEQREKFPRLFRRELEGTKDG
jgi:Helicase HerA, central domain